MEQIARENHCEHGYRKPGKWMGSSDYDSECHSNNLHSEWMEGEWVSFHKDVGLHRYKCTQCGEIGYYSSRAREFYEEGKGSLP